MAEPPVVSIIVPCFNQAGVLLGALQSCQRQSYRPLEIILVDDGSTDSSGEIAKGWAASLPDLKFRLIRQDNQGPASARQAGLEEARGSYIQYLDGDDLLEPDKIRPQVEYLEHHPEVGAVYGDWKDRPQSERVSLPEHRRSFPLDDFLREMVGGNWIALHAFLIRREAAASYPWDVDLDALEDLDYWVQLSLRGISFRHIATPDCAVYCQDPDRHRRNRIDERWLAARSQLQAKNRSSLEKAGLLALPAYRESLAKAYLGLAWRALLAQSRPSYEQAVAAALELLPEDRLCQIQWMVRLNRWLGVRRSLRWQAARERLKQRAKGIVYRQAAFDLQLTLSENLHQKMRWPTRTS